MEYTCKIESPSKVQRKLTITVPGTEIEKLIDRNLKEIQRTAKVKGFRPGKVPMTFIAQQYGDDVRHQTFHAAIKDSYSQALQEKKVRVIGQPNIETPGLKGHALPQGQDLTYIATVEVIPDVEVKDYRGIPLKKAKVEVTDKEVDEILDHYRGSQAQLIPLSEDRPVKTKDFVDTDFKGGLLLDGQYQEKPEMCGNQVIEVGSKSMIPGFEDELIGLKPGMEKTFKIFFPKEYGSADYAGKEAQFTVKVNEIKKKELPELNEEFAKQVGAASVAELKEKTKGNLSKRKEQEAEEQMRNDILKYLVDHHKMDIPRQLTLAQAKRLMEEFTEAMQQQGMKEEQIGEMIKKEEKKIMERAESQVKAALLLEAISDRENITVSEEEISLEISRMAKSMQMKEQEVRKFYSQNPDRLDNLSYKIREDKTIKLILSQANIK